MSSPRRNPATDFSRAKVHRRFNQIARTHTSHPRFRGWYFDVIADSPEPDIDPPHIEHEPRDSSWHRKVRAGAALTAVVVVVAGTVVAAVPIGDSLNGTPGVVETTPGAPGNKDPEPSPSPEPAPQRCWILHLPPGCLEP